MKTGTDIDMAPQTGNRHTFVQAHAPRKLTFAENALLTVKLLAFFALLGLALWGLSAWTTSR